MNNKRYLEKNGPVGAGYPAGNIHMWVVHSAYGAGAIQIRNVPTDRAGLGRDDEYTSCIWFNDREEWKIAYRWARKIARGGRVDGVDEAAAPRHLKYEIALRHYEVCHGRTVQKNGVRFKGQLFTAPVLAVEYPGVIALVRPDQENPGVVSVFTTDGKLICRATREDATTHTEAQETLQKVFGITGVSDAVTNALLEERNRDALHLWIDEQCKDEGGYLAALLTFINATRHCAAVGGV